MPAHRVLSPEQEQEVWQLWVRRTPRNTIARHYDVHPNTVSATIKRLLTELGPARAEELEAVRDQSLAVYREIQGDAWKRLTKCVPTSNAGVGLLSVITEAQKQQDRLLGLEQLTVNHRGVHLARIEAILTSDVPIQLPGPDNADAA